MGCPAAVTAGFDAPGAFGGGVGLQQPSAGLGGMFGGGLGVQQPHGGLGGGGGGGGGFDLGGGGGGGGGLGYGSPLSNGNGMPAVSATDALLFRGQVRAVLGGWAGIFRGQLGAAACAPERHVERASRSHGALPDAPIVRSCTCPLPRVARCRSPWLRAWVASA
jgi:hypothetical protein